MNDKKNFSELLKDAMGFRGLSIEKLSEATDIPKNYLIAFIEADFKKLPPLPYVRGCLMAIAENLGINGLELWASYKEEISSRIAKDDNLPSNRFAPRRLSKKKIIIGIVAIFAIIYFIWRFNNIIGFPEIKIYFPQSDNIIVNKQMIKLSGEIDNPLDKFTVNNEEIPIEKSGKFEKEYQLQPGVNKIEFKAKRFLGKETKVEKKIIYQP